MLAELMRMKYGIVIAGSHGKTTTTSLIAEVMNVGKLDPTVIVGGRIKGLNSNARLGKSDILVAEADESDGTFLKLSPTYAVSTNIDREHLDFYGDYESLKSAFINFLNSVPFYGMSVICIDDEGNRSIIPQIKRKYYSYGILQDADIVARDIEKKGEGMSFSVKYRGKDMGRFYLKLKGIHNVSNSLPSILLGLEFDVPVDVFRDALSNFSGIERRLEVKGRIGKTLLLDDYGHHPAEIMATLKSIRDFYAGKIVVLFQPHRYSRTQLLMDDFAKSFFDADIVFITEIYPAGERMINGISAKVLRDKMTEYGHKNVYFVQSIESAAGMIRDMIDKGIDVFLSLGAGDVYKIHEKLFKVFEDKNGRY